MALQQEREIERSGIKKAAEEYITAEHNASVNRDTKETAPAEEKCAL